jgi:cytochrome b6-f complex iron-sulfur subunit
MSSNLIPSGPLPNRKTTRRAFLGWWIGAVLSATAISVIAPVIVYIFPPRGPNQARQKIRVALDRSVDALPEGSASRFDSPPGMAFVMADGGGVNSPGDPTFGGFLTRDHGKLRALAITCPHLGCSYAFDDGRKRFVCPCHGSEFALDGSVLHGPATSPLSHLTWDIGPGVNEIDVEGLSIGA